MSQQFYQEFSQSEFIVRDRLALHRTVLANERTLLAYVRTAMAFLITGIGFLKFFDDIWVEILGVIFCISAVITMAIGVTRYRFYNKKLKRDNRGIWQ